MNLGLLFIEALTRAVLGMGIVVA